MRMLIACTVGLGLLITGLGMTSEVWASQSCFECDMVFNQATGAFVCAGTKTPPPGFPCQAFQSPHYPIVGYTQCWYNALAFVPPPPPAFMGCQTLQVVAPGGTTFSCLDFIPQCPRARCWKGPHQCGAGIPATWRTCICR